MAEQIVNQAAVQQAAGEHTSIQTSTAEGILIQSPTGVLHVPEGITTSQGAGQTGMVIGTEVMVHDAGDNQHGEVCVTSYTHFPTRRLWHALEKTARRFHVAI